MVLLPIPRGGVFDYAQEGIVITRIVHQMQVGQHVLDLAAPIELEPIDDLIGHAFVVERELQASR